MCGNWLVVNNVSHVPTGLKHAKKSQAIENAWMYLPTTIGHDAYNHLGAKVNKEADAFAETHLLPCLNSPCMRIFTSTQVRNVAHNAVQCSTEKNLVLLETDSALLFRFTNQVQPLTLYMVIQMNSSVRRLIWFWRKK